jgi:hypothetical protein
VFHSEADDAEGWITRCERASGANVWADERKVLGFLRVLQMTQFNWLDTLESKHQWS